MRHAAAFGDPRGRPQRWPQAAGEPRPGLPQRGRPLRGRRGGGGRHPGHQGADQPGAGGVPGPSRRGHHRAGARRGHRQGVPDPAAAAAAQATTHFWTPWEQVPDLAPLRTQLGPAAFAAAWAEGRTLPPEQVAPLPGLYFVLAAVGTGMFAAFEQEACQGDALTCRSQICRAQAPEGKCCSGRHHHATNISRVMAKPNNFIATRRDPSAVL